MTPSIERADVPAAAAITALTGEMLEEIQAAIGERVFRFDATRNQPRLEGALETSHCVAFLARAPHPGGEPLGSLALCEGFALYAEGSFGIIREVREPAPPGPASERPCPGSLSTKRHPIPPARIRRQRPPLKPPPSAPPQSSGGRSP